RRERVRPDLRLHGLRQGAESLTPLLIVLGDGLFSLRSQCLRLRAHVLRRVAQLCSEFPDRVADLGTHLFGCITQLGAYASGCVTRLILAGRRVCSRGIVHVCHIASFAPLPSACLTSYHPMTWQEGVPIRPRLQAQCHIQRCDIEENDGQVSCHTVSE